MHGPAWSYKNPTVTVRPLLCVQVAVSHSDSNPLVRGRMPLLTLYASRLAYGVTYSLMAGGIRYIVCCDDCGVDVVLDGPNPGGEYSTEMIARCVRDWASRAGGWLLKNPNTDEAWLSCPECAGVERKAGNLSVRHLKLAPNPQD